MAPEMLRMTDESFEFYEAGYSCVVDWWSLGKSCIVVIGSTVPVGWVTVTSRICTSTQLIPSIDSVRG